MDSIISSYDEIMTDDDLVYCKDIAYQKNMNQFIEYGMNYFETYVKLADTPISNELNRIRTALVEKHCDKCILDIGIGSGEFIRKTKLKAYGYDINPYGIDWLTERNIFVNPYSAIPQDVQGITLWDTLEHIRNPQELFDNIRTGMFMFVSLPTFENVTLVKQSKHFKPNEHYYYFSVPGFIRFINDSGFDYLEHSDAETKAGREGITSFICRRR